MRFTLYVPRHQADHWSPDAMSFSEFQQQLAQATGNITVTTADATTREASNLPVLVVDTTIPSGDRDMRDAVEMLFSSYINALLAQGEDEVHGIVADEPIRFHLT